MVMSIGSRSKLYTSKTGLKEEDLFKNPFDYTQMKPESNVELIMNDRQMLDWIQENNPIISKACGLWRVVINDRIWAVDTTLRFAIQACADKYVKKG